MAVRLPRVQTTQPQFSAAPAAGNPLCEGLTYLHNPAIGFPDGAGPGYIYPTIAYLKTKTMGDHVGLDFPGDGGVSGNGPHAIIDSSMMTSPRGTVAILMRTTDVHIDGSPNYSATLVAKCSNVGSQGGFTFRMNAGANAGVAFQIKTVGNVDVANSIGTIVVNDGKPHLISFVYGQATTDFCYWLIDGVYEASTGSSPTAAWSFDAACDGVHIGGAQDPFWGYLLGQVALIAIWNRQLTDPEQKSLAENPWQLFQSPPLVFTEMAANVSLQTVYPSSDISAGNWTPSTGVSLYATINENPASDAQYDSTPNASAMEVKLQPASAPGVTTGHVVRYRCKGAGVLTVSLVQGTTIIATWTHSPAPAVYTTFGQTLTGGQAAAITDYTDLRLRFTAS